MKGMTAFPLPLDEARQRRELERGQAAKTLMETPLLKEAFETVETALISAWLESPPSAWREREQIYAEIRGLIRAKGHLHEVMQTGKLAAMVINAA